MRRPLFAAVLLAFASLAHADAIRLTAPANGATLRGGSFAEVSWSAAQLPASAEEWEAFLSINGGRYYAFRITPHLDIDRNRFRFVVPNVDTHDARILIRIGDEVHESHFEMRGSFSIARDAHAEQLVHELLQFGRGEAARDGDPAVLSWTDGARNGSGVTQQFATNIPCPSLERLASWNGDSSSTIESAASWATTPAIASAWRPFHRERSHKFEPLAIPEDLLLVCRRRNI